MRDFIEKLESAAEAGTTKGAFRQPSGQLLSALLSSWFWRAVFISVFFLFAWFVWPTPYKQLPAGADGLIPTRQNRFSGEIQFWSSDAGEWNWYSGY